MCNKLRHLRISDRIRRTGGEHVVRVSRNMFLVDRIVIGWCGDVEPLYRAQFRLMDWHCSSYCLSFLLSLHHARPSSTPQLLPNIYAVLPPVVKCTASRHCVVLHCRAAHTTVQLPVAAQIHSISIS